MSSGSSVGNDINKIAKIYTAAAATTAKVGNNKRKNTAHKNILQNNSYMADVERDELHIEIYNYLFWLHEKLVDVDEQMKSSSAVGDTEGDDADNMSIEGDDNMESKKSPAGKKRSTPLDIKGIHLTELRNAMDKLELAFAVIPNAKADASTAAAANSAAATSAIASEEMGISTQAKPPSPPPFLETALPNALKELVAAREGKRRSRKRGRKRKSDATTATLSADGKPTKPHGNKGHSRTPGNFDEMYDRLVAYKNEHGNCMVQKSYTRDPKLANWVRGIREKKKSNLKRGIDVEVVPEGQKVLSKALTAERLARLDALGFVWSVQGPKTSWDDRYNDLCEYYQTNGKWPSQTNGQLGEW